MLTDTLQSGASPLPHLVLCLSEVEGQANREVARLTRVDPIVAVGSLVVPFIEQVVEVQPHRHVLRGLVMGQQIHGVVGGQFEACAGFA